MKLLNKTNLPYKIGDYVIYNPEYMKFIKPYCAYDIQFYTIEDFNKENWFVQDIARFRKKDLVIVDLQKPDFIGNDSVLRYYVDRNGRSTEKINKEFDGSILVKK